MIRGGIAGVLGGAVLLSLVGIHTAHGEGPNAAQVSNAAAASDTTQASDAPPGAHPPLDESLYDPDNALDIMEVCAACHGEFGEGGGAGSYPRLAGLPAEYIAEQLRAFKSRERENIAMFPFATERELPEEDVRDISILLARVELLSRMPEMPDSATAYERLMVAQRVFNVAKVDGDHSNGQSIYKNLCRRCHGKQGQGRRKTPPLAGQYPIYLRRQIQRFLDGERSHKNVDKYLRPQSEQDWDDVLAYLASLDD